MRSLSFARKSVGKSIWVGRARVKVWIRIHPPFNSSLTTHLTSLLKYSCLQIFEKRETAQSLKGLRTLVWPAWQTLERFKGEGDLGIRQDTRKKGGEFLTLSYCVLFMLHVHPSHFFFNVCHTVMLTSAPKHSLFLGSPPQSERILGTRLLKLIYSI